MATKRKKNEKSLKIFFSETRRHRALIFVCHKLEHGNKGGKLQNSSSMKLEGLEL